MIALEVLVILAGMFIAVGALSQSLYSERLDRRRRARITVLQTELKLANAIVDSVAPPVAGQPDR